MNRFAKLFSLNKPAWLTRHVFVLIISVIIFILAMMWSEPISQAAAMQQNQSKSPQNLILIPDTVHPKTVSVIQERLIFNSQQTNGVIIGAAILLFIIFSGVIMGSQQTKTD